MHTSRSAPGLSFVDEAKRFFNVYRLLPIGNVEEAMQHDREVYLNMELSYIANAKPHTSLFLCEYCQDEDLLEFAFSCCQIHLEVSKRLARPSVCVYAHARACVCVCASFVNELFQLIN